MGGLASDPSMVVLAVVDAVSERASGVAAYLRPPLSTGRSKWGT